MNHMYGKQLLNCLWALYKILHYACTFASKRLSPPESVNRPHKDQLFVEVKLREVVCTFQNLRCTIYPPLNCVA